MFNADKNPIINRVLRVVLYDQYAAGATVTDVLRTTKEIKAMGYNGVILGSAKEAVLQSPSKRAIGSDHSYAMAQERVIERWKEEQLLTLEMIDEGDFLALK